MSYPLVVGDPTPLHHHLSHHPACFLLQLVMTVNDFYSFICGLFLPQDCNSLRAGTVLVLFKFSPTAWQRACWMNKRSGE